MIDERPHITALQDPFVFEANIYDFSTGVILSDRVLKHQIDYAKKVSKLGGSSYRHFDWLLRVFPELNSADKVPIPWVWQDLVSHIGNIGDLNRTKEINNKWVTAGKKVAYWTGNSELTQNHYKVASYLLENEFNIVLGIEPSTSKDRGAITHFSFFTSLWSKLLREKGFIFLIPRPLPDDPNSLDKFYDNLYETVTNRKASIVISERDPYKTNKLGRGPVVQVPSFDHPQTTQIYWDTY